MLFRSDEHGRHAPFHYARYLTKHLKTFSALLPRRTSENRPVDHQYTDSAYGFPHRSDANSLSNLSSWAGQIPEPSFHDNRLSVDTGLGHGPLYDVPGLHRPFVDEQAIELSGCPVDFSLTSFLQTVNDPQYTKNTPPPGEPENNHWWQHMYPVNNQTSWPMAIGNHAAQTLQNQHLSAER